jgi:hypothetical protein
MLRSILAKWIESRSSKGLRGGRWSLLSVAETNPLLSVSGACVELYNTVRTALHSLTIQVLNNYFRVIYNLL